MSPQLPEGNRLPQNGTLDPVLAAGKNNTQTTFSAYVHVPFCARRCGYCDFNTYTSLDLGPGASLADYPQTLAREITLSKKILEQAKFPPPKLTSVFFGGGTPTLLKAPELVQCLRYLTDSFQLNSGAEVTVEANPDTVDEEYLNTLAKGGVTRISFGMQSAVGRILQLLDRTHRQERVAQVVAAARAVGLKTSLDLIYATPTESLAEWQRSLDAVLAIAPDHISAYALVIEDGTRMGADLKRGKIDPVDDDIAAEKYTLAEQAFSGAGYRWYEVSNWAKATDCAGVSSQKLWEENMCQHNMAYWRDQNWWGYGPGAHSHIGQIRWWNAKHPRSWAGSLLAGQSPNAGSEIIDSEAGRLEKIMLGVRLAQGLDTSWVASQGALSRLIAEDLIEANACKDGKVILTLRGRLLADYVTGVLCGW